MVVGVVGLPAPEEGQSVIGGVGVGGDVVVVAVVAAALRRKALAADSAVEWKSDEVRRQPLFFLQVGPSGRGRLFVEIN